MLFSFASASRAAFQLKKEKTRSGWPMLNRRRLRLVAEQEAIYAAERQGIIEQFREAFPPMSII
jgi:hypothetical protein